MNSVGGSLSALGAVFPALVTSTGTQVTSGAASGLSTYDFTEVLPDPATGAYVPMTMGRRGGQWDVSSGSTVYAVELNNTAVTASSGSPQHVWMRPRGTPGGQPMYEFAGPGGGTTFNGAQLVLSGTQAISGYYSGQAPFYPLIMTLSGASRLAYDTGGFATSGGWLTAPSTGYYMIDAWLQYAKPNLTASGVLSNDCLVYDLFLTANWSSSGGTLTQDEKTHYVGPGSSGTNTNVSLSLSFPMSLTAGDALLPGSRVFYARSGTLTNNTTNLIDGRFAMTAIH